MRGGARPGGHAPCAAARADRRGAALIPIYDNVHGRRFPFVNLSIIAANFIIFFYELSLQGQTIAPGVTRLDEFIARWGNIPACTLNSLGWQDLSVRASLYCAQQPHPLATVITAMFIHGGWLHILGNMLFLWIFGDNVEDAMGHARYLAFYFLVGIIAAFTYAGVNTDGLTPAIGASGAIAGVMGAYLVLYPRATVAVLIVFIPLPVPAFILIGVWFIVQVFSGFSTFNTNAVGAGGGIAYFAHIGGFIAGALLVKLFTIGQPKRQVGRLRRFGAKGWFDDLF